MFTRLGILAGHLSDTKTRISVSVVVATCFFGLFEFAIEKTILQLNVPADLHSALEAAVVGLGAGGSLWLILVTARERRRVIADELRRVAELNHTIRNSLEVIALANYSTKNTAQRAMVIESTNRIEEKLRELFPVLGTRDSDIPKELTGPGC